MTLRQKAAELKSAMQGLVDRATAEGRDLSEADAKQIEEWGAEYRSLTEQAERAEKASRLVADLASGSPDVPDDLDNPSKSGSIGEAFVTSEAFRSFRKAHPSGVGGGTPVRIEAKNVGRFGDVLRKAPLTTETGQVQPLRAPGYRSDLLDDRLTLLDLITTGTTAASYFEYARVVSETDNAAIVPEGELKPLSDLATDLADAKAYTYADGFDATNQQLADDGALIAFMDGRIRRHVRSKVEDVILNGAGTATEPAGIMNTTGVQSQAFDTDVLTTVARALEKVDDVDADPQAVVLHPRDFWSLRLLRENGNTGPYMSGGPFTSGGTPSLWGVPLVTSRRVAQGTALVGNFRSVNFLEREPLSVLAFNQHKDYAQRNMVYVRAELRGMQLIYAPREIVVATLAAAG